MLFKYNIKDKKFQSLQESSFSAFNVLERQDIEKWVEENPDIVGEELLIISTEYDKFDKTNERLDILAIDKVGKIVVIELKRDDSGRHVELQAIKYAAYCSTLTLKDTIELRKAYLNKKGMVKSFEEVEKGILDFIENDEFEEIDDKPRIILVSREFRQEVTASVLWLRSFQIGIISQLVGESLVDFQCEVPQVMEAVGLALDDLDLVVDPFELPRMDGVVTVVEDPVAMSLQHVGEGAQRLLLEGSGQRTPLIERLGRPGT